MADDAGRTEHLLQLREELFREMETAEQEWAAVRVRVERMESDIRVGRPEATGFQQAKGRDLPGAEGRVVELFRQLLKLEDKINDAARNP